MFSRLPHGRQRLLDLVALLGALLIGAHGGPALPITLPTGGLALLVWSVGLSLMGHYKAGAAPALLASVSKLLIDHAILCAVWFGALFLVGPKPSLSSVLIFGGVSFPLLMLARVRFHDNEANRSSRNSTAAIAVATDVIITLAALYTASGFWRGTAVPASLLVTVVGGRVLVSGVALFIARPVLAWVASQSIFIGLLLGADQMFGWPQAPAQLAFDAGLLPALGIGAYRLRRVYRPRADTGEICRRLSLAAVALALLHPLFSAQLMGASDAKLYAEAMQDFLGQIRAGIFPVFVTQTEIAPFGSVFPFRMAFYHFHFGALLDRLTFGSLNPYAIQHLTLVLSAAGGAFAMYAVLKRLARTLPWECAALAALYIACPAWLSTLYGLDMYFTAMTLPWLPLVIYAIVRTFDPQCGWRSYLLLGVALAATWLAHPPVGFWTAVVVCLSQSLRLATAGHWPTRRDFSGLTLAVVACLLLCAGLFVSLADVRIPGELADPTPQVLSSLNRVVPKVFQPVSPAADRLSDLQLGYAWQALLLSGLFLFPRARTRAHWILSGLAIGLLVLIYPVPGLTSALWRAIPWEVTNITNVWPMQRLYPIVVTLSAFVALGAFRVIEGPRFATLRLSVLGALCVWSGFEAAKFARRGLAHTKPTEETRILSKVENSALLSSWTAYTPRLPARPLVGAVNDPRLLNRILDPQTKAELISNHRVASAAPATPPATGLVADAVPLDPGTMRVTPSFTLEPSRRYQLTLYFSGSEHNGLLQLMPLKDFHPRLYRELLLTPANTSIPLTVTVWTTEATPVTVDLRFIPARPADARQTKPGFFTYQLIPYRADELPIKVTSLAPYTAAVETTRASFLETHRFYARGYRATVNGLVVPVTESPDHLAMLPLVAGKNDVRLDYVGPPAVRAAFWISAFAWIALAGFATWLVLQRWRDRSRPASSPASTAPEPSSA